MIRTTLMASAILTLLAGSAFAGEGWKRQGTVTGPNGGVTTLQGGGKCTPGVNGVGGTCTTTGTVTGPNGNSTTRQGVVTRTGPGQFTTSSTRTGPKGRILKRNGTVSVN
jgi:hypothetical protein